MAATDQKRNSTVGRVATPKANNSQSGFTVPQGPSDMDAALSKVVGGRIRVTMTAPTSSTYEGTVFAVCPITNIVAINTASANGPGDFRVIPVSQISNFHIISNATPDGAVASPSTGFGSFSDPSLSISKVDMGALRAREAEAISKIREHDSTRGKGVTKEAQEIFDWFKRTLPTRWNGQTIIVNDAVLIEPPYAVENLRAPKDSKHAEAQIKRVLEGYYHKRKGGGNSNANTATGSTVNSGANTPIPVSSAPGRTVVPALPRKGG